VPPSETVAKRGNTVKLSYYYEARQKRNLPRREIRRTESHKKFGYNFITVLNDINSSSRKFR